MGDLRSDRKIIGSRKKGLLRLFEVRDFSSLSIGDADRPIFVTEVKRISFRAPGEHLAAQRLAQSFQVRLVLFAALRLGHEMPYAKDDNRSHHDGENHDTDDHFHNTAHSKIQLETRITCLFG